VAAAAIGGNADAVPAGTIVPDGVIVAGAGLLAVAAAPTLGDDATVDGEPGWFFLPPLQATSSSARQNHAEIAGRLYAFIPTTHSTHPTRCRRLLPA
jgi:hypothetical protein